MNSTYGIPNERVLIAIREELELMGFGDEQIRTLTNKHSYEKLIEVINQVLMMDVKEPMMALTALLNTNGTKDTRLGKQAIEAIKGRLGSKP